MVIQSIKLSNYRNFCNYTLDIKPRGAIFLGKNGSGKTNILEAICLFAFGKSFRNCKDENLIKFDSDYYRIEANFELNKQYFYTTAAANKQKKVFTLNGKVLKKTSELYHYFKMIYLSPDDITLISGSASKRRQFLNQALSQSNDVYLHQFRAYYGILKHRNSLLKINFTKIEKRTWDKQFAEATVALIQLRKKYIKFLGKLVEEKYKVISGNKEKVSIYYKSFFGDSNYFDVLKELVKIEEKEKLFGHTLKGPHLDDIAINIDGKDSRQFASQGQKRSLAIALKLAQTQLIENYNPIIMFDDVLLDLDLERTKNVLSIVPINSQIFIATPQALPNLFSHLQTINL